MTGELIVTELSEGVFTVLLNRPEKKNALNLAMYGALAGALEEADRDDRVRAVLFTGSGGCFTSGNDIADFLQTSFLEKDGPVLRFLQALCGARKPLVAAVEGMAVGVGVTMLLHCDLAYAGEGAVFQAPFVNLGLCPEAGSTLLMPRMMGHQRAAELLLLGEPFTAGRAREVGIVNALFPDGEVTDGARAKALRLASQPPAAVRLAKELLKRDSAATLGETVLHEAACFLERLQSPEATEALHAFMQRRAPDFSRFN
ncbi:MAG TPA: enoyl-CoA hydratase [Desulfuromonadaceae bacterium]